MIFMNTLRMVVDLSFYCFFAEFVVALLGGTSMLGEMLLLSLGYGLLLHVQKFIKNRVISFLPALILFLPKELGMTWPNRLVLLPAIFYIIYLLYKEETGFSWGRQADIFSVCWKVFLGTSVILCLAGNYQLFLQTSLPMALISLASSVLFLRMLRHEPKVYLSRQFQVKNMLFLAGVLAVAWLSSQKIVLEGIVSLGKCIYRYGIYPVLYLVIFCLMALIRLVSSLLSWMKFGTILLNGEGVERSEGVNPFADIKSGVADNTGTVEQVFIFIGIVILIVAAIFLFRWMARGWSSDKEKEKGVVIFKGFEKKETKRKRSASVVHQVRRQYQKFLQSYKAQGERVLVADTSKDIMQKSEHYFRNSDELKEMREIYIRARYDENVSRADLRRMKQINQQLRQKEE